VDRRRKLCVSFHGIGESQEVQLFAIAAPGQLVRDIGRNAATISRGIEADHVTWIYIDRQKVEMTASRAGAERH
jgi:hypothetical protein